MNSNHQIGLQYYFGIDGKSRNYTLATEYFKKGASDKNFESVYSMIMLSKCYLQGLGINEDEEQGLMWLVKAANSSNGLSTAYAKNELGMLILNNIKTQNPDEVKIYCNSLQSDSEIKLGSTAINLNDIIERLEKDHGERTNFDDDDGSEEDEDHYGVGDAIKLLMEAADEGHVEARTNLGRVYEEAGDLEQANHCYLQAIQSGCCKSTYLLGHLYLLQYNNNSAVAVNGSLLDKKGLSKYQQRAFVLLKTAALNGETEAFSLLGQCYELGKGMSHPDINQAIYYYRKGSKLGDKVSMYNLGLLLINQSTRKVKEKPNKQLLILENTDSNCNNRSSDTVESKEKDSQAQAKNDIEEGICLLRRSSDLEYKDAAYELGKLYEFGVVVDGDIHAALRYYKWGAKLGHNDCALFAANILYSQANTFSNILLIFEASTLYYQAAINGLPSAMNAYGILLEDGLTNEDGVKFTQDAAAWYYQAAILGEQKAFFNLAALLANDDTFAIFPSVFSEGNFITIGEAKITLDNYFNGKSFLGNDDERVKALEIVSSIRDIDEKILLTMKNENLAAEIHSPANKSSGSYTKKLSNSSYSPGNSINSKAVRHRSQSTTASLESGSIDSRKIPKIKKSFHKNKQTLSKEVESTCNEKNDFKEENGVQYSTNGFVYPPNYAPPVKAHTAPVSSNKPPNRNPIQEIIPPVLTSLNKKVQLPTDASNIVPLTTEANNNIQLPTEVNNNVQLSIVANKKEELLVRENPSPPSNVTLQTVELVQNTNLLEENTQQAFTKPRKKPSFIVSILRPFTARKHEMKYVGPYKKQSNTENDEQFSSTVLSTKLKSKQISKSTFISGSDNVQDQSISTYNDAGDPTSDISLSSKEFP